MCARGAKTIYAQWTLGTKEKPDTVGDIVLNNGRAIAYEEGLALDDDLKTATVAVIFYNGAASDLLDEKKLAVGLVINASIETAGGTVIGSGWYRSCSQHSTSDREVRSLEFSANPYVGASVKDTYKPLCVMLAF